MHGGLRIDLNRIGKHVWSLFFLRLWIVLPWDVELPGGVELLERQLVSRLIRFSFEYISSKDQLRFQNILTQPFFQASIEYKLNSSLVQVNMDISFQQKSINNEKVHFGTLESGEKPLVCTTNMAEI